MNEEIIIDEVDVSECEHLINDRLHNCECMAESTVYPETTIYDDCKGINCYFKQFKRLQEENKSLQMLSCANCGEKYLSPEGSELYEKNVQLQKENEELKEDINKRTHCISCQRELENCRLSITNAKYKQALEKIRNILCYGRTFYDGYFDNPNLSRTDEAVKVINEVLNDNKENQ